MPELNPVTINEIDEIATILVLLSKDYASKTAFAEGRMRGPAGIHELISNTIYVVYADGWSPTDLVHPEGIEALAMYMYSIATGTWEQAIPADWTKHYDTISNNRVGRWRRVLQRTGSIRMDVTLATKYPPRNRK